MSSIEANGEKLDREIGLRLRVARRSRGVTQAQLADALGISFQQIQKYERGVNRISSSALVMLARALNLSAAELLGSGGPASAVDWDLMAVEGSQDLLSAYAAIRGPRLRRLVRELARELAEEAPAADTSAAA